jgi:integrase/recombinase XerD
MANREVNLTKRVQPPQGWRYCRVLLSANGRVKPDVVVVNGKEERHPEGAYYLEWREGCETDAAVGWEGSCRRRCATVTQRSRVERGKQWHRRGA